MAINKRKIIKIVFYLSIVIIQAFICLMANLVTPESADQEALFEQNQERKSITFLMGEDKAGKNYFQLAERHFLFDTEEATDHLVKSCRSIEDLIKYLNSYQSHCQPWDVIQIVVHGNVWSGLSPPITNDGPRATPKNLVKTLMDNPLPHLKDVVVDSQTQINIWGCGVGKNPFINLALDSILKTESGVSPSIYTSPHFVIFKESEDGSAPKRLKASYWPYMFRRGYRPSESLIAQEMAKNFPEAHVDWQKVVKKKSIQKKDDVFRESFHLPVSYTLVYANKKDRPSVSTQEEKLKWVQSQDALMDQIDELQIPIEKFNWTVNKIIHTREDGSKVPAIKAIGMTTVMCFIDIL